MKHTATTLSVILFSLTAIQTVSGQQNGGGSSGGGHPKIVVPETIVQPNGEGSSSGGDAKAPSLVVDCKESYINCPLEGIHISCNSDCIKATQELVEFGGTSILLDMCKKEAKLEKRAKRHPSKSKQVDVDGE